MVDKAITKTRTTRQARPTITGNRRRIVYMRPTNVEYICRKLYKNSSETQLALLRKRVSVFTLDPVQPDTNLDDHTYITLHFKSTNPNAAPRKPAQFILTPFAGDTLDVGRFFVTTRHHNFLLVVRADRNVASLESAFSGMSIITAE